MKRLEPTGHGQRSSGHLIIKCALCDTVVACCRQQHALLPLQRLKLGDIQRASTAGSGTQMGVGTMARCIPAARSQQVYASHTPSGESQLPCMTGMKPLELLDAWLGIHSSRVLAANDQVQ